MLRGRSHSATLVFCVCLGLIAWADTPTGRRAPKVRLPARAAVDAYVLGPTALVAGSSASYRIAVHWASGPRSSGPLPGARVVLALVLRDVEKVLASGETDETGSLNPHFTVPAVETGRGTLLVRITSPLGKVERRTEVSIFPGGRLLLTTDKKLYQPSQTIHLRVLALRSADLKPVGGREVSLRVVDPRGNVLLRERRRTSRFGVASLDFALADEITLGRYRLEGEVVGADAGGVTRREVDVRRYVLPAYKVTVEAEQSSYRPGETVRGTVRARYFFGKPVAGARVAVELLSRLRGAVQRTLLSSLTTDAEGRATFAAEIGPAARPGSEEIGEVRVVATAVDTAGQRQEGDLALPLTSRPLRLALVPENPEVVAGVPNRIHVLAALPDGKPAPDVEIVLTNGPERRAGRTDALGVCTLEVLPRAVRAAAGDGAGDVGSPPRRLVLAAAATTRLGQRASVRAELPVAPRGAVLIRPKRSLVPPGEPVELVLLGGGGSSEERRVYLDVLKAGQTLATYTASLEGGRAALRFLSDDALFGLLELRAYRLRPGGEREGSSRLVYVDHPGELRISAHADRPSHRPGERARLQFEVKDSRTGDGVEAALGLVGVDEAVLALSDPAETSPKVFFTLAAEAAPGGSTPEVSPGGRDLAAWVSSTEAVSRRARAADVLLAALEPAEKPAFETNPWKERREAWDRQAPTLVEAALAYMKRSERSVGVRTAEGWRFDPDLVPRLVRAGAIKPTAAEDPWRRTVRPYHLREKDPSFVFSTHATQLARERLARVYEVLAERWDSKELGLGREPMTRLAHRRWPLVLPRDLPARLLGMGRLAPEEIVDPWGQPFRVLPNPHLYVNPYSTGLVSRYFIHSAGPDGVSGTRDDIGPEGPRLAVIFGADSALGADSQDALGHLIGSAIGDIYGVGGLGLVGTGAGGGGSGMGTIGLGHLGTIGRGGGGAMPSRVRSLFPETLFVRPELVTDKNGRASLEVDLADSITDWRVLVTGSTEGGLLGTTSFGLRVFQDFFVELGLPVALTQGDRISVPVTVYNYLKTPQRISLRLEREGWFTPAGPLEQTIELGPAQVGVRTFPIVAARVGRQDLTVRAVSRGGAGPGVADAVRRSTLVEPDGLEHARSTGGVLRREASHEVEIPAGAIPGTSHVQLSMYAGSLGQTLSGMEGMLRMPGGCFEQTSSTTYPNVLVLDYLRRSGRATPVLERKAKELIGLGYQRLASFEVKGGGFSWFGDAPANKVLTAYGLMEFADMARVHPVDPELIRRTRAWLASQQRPDGSFGLDGHGIDEGATNRYKDTLRVTAYVALALARSTPRAAAAGQDGAAPALRRALAHVARHEPEARDPYTLAVLANLFAEQGGGGAAARRVRDRLWAAHRSSEAGAYFEGPASTLTYGGGATARLETTALAALGLLGGKEPPEGATRLVDTLVAGKDAFGSWHSTQATILSLRALLLAEEQARVLPEGEVEVLVDGRPGQHLRLEGERARERGVDLDLTALLGSGRHAVALRFSGKGSLQYHLVSRYWLPGHRGAPAGAATAAARAAGSLSIATRVEPATLRPGDPASLAVVVENRGSATAEMPLVSLSIPPGFEVDERGLTALVGRGQVDKVQRTGSRALLYLSKLARREQLRFSVGLKSAHPLRVQARPSVVYEYYRPENRGESAAQTVEVL
jgi:hypothetical protein